MKRRIAVWLLCLLVSRSWATRHQRALFEAASSRRNLEFVTPLLATPVTSTANVPKKRSAPGKEYGLVESRAAGVKRKMYRHVSTDFACDEILEEIDGFDDY